MGRVGNRPRIACLNRDVYYIVRRSQLYFDDRMWGALHARARREKTTVSELVRQAVRNRYLGDLEQRRLAMQRFVGVRRSQEKDIDSTEEVRRLRRGSRLDRSVDR